MGHLSNTAYESMNEKLRPLEDLAEEPPPEVEFHQDGFTKTELRNPMK